MSFRLPTLVLLALIGLAFATLIGLGAWQVQRAGWRADLIASRNAQLASPPLDAEATGALPSASLDYRVVALAGRWDDQHVLTLANKARYGMKGENIVQPFILASGDAVLVDRGWYPVEQREAALARLRQANATPVAGLARYVEGLSASRTVAGTWTGIAPASMATGLPYRVLPWFVVEGQLLPDNAPFPSAFPMQGFERYTSDTPHVEYALTWFGLAAALVAITTLRFIVEPRRARARLDAAPPQH